MEIIKVEHLKKSFGTNLVLNDINVEVEKGEVICLIGASGSGKSTLLRCLNLLEEPDEGNIIYHGKDILNDSVNIEEIRKSMGMVFQSFNLFENLTVLHNCTLAPKLVLRENRATTEKRALMYLEKVGLQNFSNAKVSTLSGGQKQRVAIARALCMNPDIMLFDEPTSALDPESVDEVLQVMQDLALQGMTMIIVTHEMMFARDVANRILFMKDGKIIEEGAPQTLFNNPQRDETYNFLKKYINK